MYRIVGSAAQAPVAGHRARAPAPTTSARVSAQRTFAAAERRVIVSLLVDTRVGPRTGGPEVRGHDDQSVLPCQGAGPGPRASPDAVRWGAEALTRSREEERDAGSHARRHENGSRHARRAQ